MLAAVGLSGVSVAMVPVLSTSTVAGTSVWDPFARSLIVSLVSVATSIGLLNVTTTLALRAIPVVPLAGVRDWMTGAPPAGAGVGGPGGAAAPVVVKLHVTGAPSATPCGVASFTVPSIVTVYKTPGSVGALGVSVNTRCAASGSTFAGTSAA